MHAIQTSHLRKLFGGRPAVDDLSLEVRPGETVGLLGPNGAGKTTTLRLLTGLLQATSGEIEVLGQRVSRGVAARGVGAVIDRPALIPHLSGEDNLRVFASVGGLRSTGSARRQLLGRVGLDPLDRRPTRAYSTGMRQRLALAVALAGDPRLLVLDEPTDGLDPSGIIDLRDLLLGLSAAGTTVLLSSHLLGEVERVCSRVVIVVRGRVVAEGAPSEIAPPNRSAELGFVDAGSAEAAAGIARGRGMQAAARGSAVVVGVAPEDLAKLLGALGQAGMVPVSVSAGRVSLEDAYRRYVDSPSAAAAD